MAVQRIDIGKTQPASYKALVALHNASVDAAAGAGVSARVIELVNLRASQTNGCAFCLRLHSTDALAGGETPDRLAVLSAWRETQYFTDAETAALRISEYVTNISAAELSEDVYAEIGEALSADQIAAVHWLAIVINAFNRVAIASHLPVVPE